MNISLKMLEENLRFSQRNLNVLTMWSKNLFSTINQVDDWYEKALRVQIQHVEKIADHTYEKDDKDFAKIVTEAQEYLTDYIQRSVLFWDTLRERGNQYIEHNNAGNPPVLIFDYETIVDGRTLLNPVNYSLVQIVPPEGVEVDNNKRPFLIVDPRSGHGAGIGGFKDDSQVGVALRAGYPVYFVIFYPEPQPDQTLRDVALAEKLFSDTVKRRHPNSMKPCIIGNCQGGWAVMMLAAASPEVAGGLVITGAPLSYWAGENGKNPMRYTGGLLGGSWLAQFASDLGDGKFDGANLVTNFESLNPSNTYWKKYYNLFSDIDEERNRFLAFEKWWGGFYLMNAYEIKSILDNLFIGNYLTRGKIQIGSDTTLDLRKIKSPIIIFCSEGDDITSPQQALHWITDIYPSDIEIKKNEQTIIYMIHSNVGHLGLFVSSNVAVKEYKEIVDVLDYAQVMPSGLYEMVIHENLERREDEPRYFVVLEERSIKDLADHGKMQPLEKDKHIFSAVRTVSRINSLTYDIFLSWGVRLFSNENTAQILRQLHPLRVSRYTLSDFNPFLKSLSLIADAVKKQRAPASPDNIFLQMQNDVSDLIESGLDNYRDARDGLNETIFYGLYSVVAEMMQEMLVRESRAVQTTFDASEQIIGNADQLMLQGGVMNAILRGLLFAVKVQGYVKGVGMGTIKQILEDVFNQPTEAQREQIRQAVRLQTFLVAYNAEQAVKTFTQLVTDKTERAVVQKTFAKIRGSLPNLHPKTVEIWKSLETILVSPKDKIPELELQVIALMQPEAIPEVKEEKIPEAAPEVKRLEKSKAKARKKKSE